MFYNDFNTDTYQDKTSDRGYGAWYLASDEYACSQSGYGKGRRNGGLDGEICRIAFVQEKFTELGIRQWKFGMVQNI